MSNQVYRGVQVVCEDAMTQRMSRVVLSEVKDTPAFQGVNVVAKALCMKEVSEVTGGKRKQDVIIADGTGAI